MLVNMPIGRSTGSILLPMKWNRAEPPSSTLPTQNIQSILPIFLDKPKEQVPNVIGQPLQQALASINNANLRLLYLKFPVTSKSQAGKIVQQSPLAGAQAPRNAQVVVYLGVFSS